MAKLDPNTPVLLVCSPTPRPAVHTGRTGGNQWWSRDVFHVAKEQRTLCGLNATNWIEIEHKTPAVVVVDHNLCERCRKKLKVLLG